MNHVLAAMLSMYVGRDDRDWDETLPHVCFAYNTARQESTGFAPFVLLYGREPRFPIAISLHVDSNAIMSREEADLTYGARLEKTLSTARNIVALRMKKVHQQQKQYYDEGRREVSYNIGDKVLVYRQVRKIGLSENYSTVGLVHLSWSEKQHQ